MENLSKSKGAIIGKLEKLRMEVLTSDSNDKSIGKQFLDHHLPKEEYEQHVDQFFTLKEEF